MIYKIYCIIDINGLKYVGKTKLTLKERLRLHRNDKKKNAGCSSEELDLDNCKMILLCECEDHEVKYREQYFKDNIKCVNIRNMVFDKKEYKTQYYIDNKETINQYNKLWKKKNKQKYSENNKLYYLSNKDKIDLYNKEYSKNYNLFRKVNVVNGCYEFIEMLNHY